MLEWSDTGPNSRRAAQQTRVLCISCCPGAAIRTSVILDHEDGSMRTWSTTYIQFCFVPSLSQALTREYFTIFVTRSHNAWPGSWGILKSHFSLWSVVLVMCIFIGEAVLQCSKLYRSCNQPCPFCKLSFMLSITQHQTLRRQKTIASNASSRPPP